MSRRSLNAAMQSYRDSRAAAAERDWIKFFELSLSAGTALRATVSFSAQAGFTMMSVWERLPEFIMLRLKVQEYPQNVFPRRAPRSKKCRCGFLP
jgi:hypothetical protein